MNLAQDRLRRAMVILLQADRPVPQHSEQEIAAEVERNYRWNFAVNLLDVTAFLFGISFVSSSTIAPLFVSKLTTSPLVIGLLAVMAQAGWFLPQLFTSNAVERLPRKKPVPVNLGFFAERLPMWLLVVSALVAARTPSLALVLFMSGYAWHTLGAGVVATGWQELIARCFPVEKRGRFFGTSAFVGTGMGALGAILSAWLLKAFPFSTNFVYVFAIAASSITVSWLFLALAREPEQPVDVPRQSNREYLAKLPGIVRSDFNFRHFLIARSLMALGGLGVGFVTVAAVQRWQVADGVVGFFTTTQLLGQTAGNLSFGFLSDRLGHKLSLELGALASTLAFALAWLAPSPAWYYLAFFLLGINSSSLIVSGTLVVMEFSTPRRRPTYVGLANTVVGLVSILAPMLGAVLVGISYGWAFAASMVINLAALVAMRWWVREPRWSAAAEL